MKFFNSKDDDLLLPAGKLYGESSGLTETIYLAVDKDGRFFQTNRLSVGPTSYDRAVWEEISAKQLAKYLQHFSFVNKKKEKSTLQSVETLKPLGKMKGEIEGQFEAFYLAVDKKGTLFRNHHMDYTRNPYDKSDRWKEISQQELAHYKKYLHLIAPKQFSVKR